MKISYLKLCQAISERTGGLSELPEGDFILKFTQRLETLCLDNIPKLGQHVVRQKRILRSGEIILIFARPEIGFGRDLEWRIELGGKSGRVAIESGDYSSSLFQHLKKFIQTRILGLLELVEAVQNQNQPEARIYLNKKLLSVSEIQTALNHSPELIIDGDLNSFKVETSLNRESSESADILEWIAASIKVLGPIFQLAGPICSEEQIQSDPEEHYLEGEPGYRMHLHRERNSDVISKAKENFKSRNNGKLYCEICQFDFLKTYGERGRDFAEAHHIHPISEMNQQGVTKVEDIRIVCSNCHRMLHRRPFFTTDQLKKLIID
jgi:predicted HNH restriction endonuclease